MRQCYKTNLRLEKYSAVYLVVWYWPVSTQEDQQPNSGVGNLFWAEGRMKIKIV